MNKRLTRIEILCHRCKDTTNKSLEYLLRRIKKGKLEFYCSKKCADESHSERMQGETNPNFNGKWNAPCPSTWSDEKRKLASKRTSETMLRLETSKGSNNGRWAGGEQEHDCIICGTVSKFSPYVHRKILSGEQSPTCSIQCAAALGRRNVPNKSTSIEIKMAEELTRRGIKYADQYNLGDKFRLDFFLPEFNIVIECDGDYWHNLPEVVIRDKRKNSYIKACDFSLYRFWEHEINTDVEACVDIVFAEINEKVAI